MTCINNFFTNNIRQQVGIEKALLLLDIQFVHILNGDSLTNHFHYFNIKCPLTN